MIVYYSHTGRTAGYARAIAMYLWSKGLNVSLCSVSDFKEEKLEDTDFLLLGCWTSGWFVIHQHPHRRWRELGRKVAGKIPPERILLFTTYLIRTGSMFRNMKRVLDISRHTPVTQLASRTGMLTGEDQRILDGFILNRSTHLNTKMYGKEKIDHGCRSTGG